ncbi:type II toxin-antitoxin system RelE/ParE family toxin [bacterium]|nr:type II toxin-antitoxin system RelE/ParE family toxin [bacterium]
MRRLSDEILLRVSNKLLQLSENPFPRGFRKLKDGNGYRVRVGDWRILFDVYKAEQKIIIFSVGHRSQVYK